MFARFTIVGLLVIALSAVVDASRCAAAEETHDAEAAEHGGGDPNPLTVDPDLSIWTAVVFLLLLAVLSKFAWPAISVALVERENRIEKNIADAALMHEQAKQLLVEHEARLAGTADQVRALLEEARRDAEHTKGQILAEAKKAADQERERALLEVQRAQDAALKNIAESSANTAVELAGQIVSHHITADQQAQLVRDALGRLSTVTPSHN